MKINGFSVRSSSLTSTNIATAPPKPSRPPIVAKTKLLENDSEKFSNLDSSIYTEIDYDIPEHLSQIHNGSFTKVSLTDASSEISSTNKTNESQKNTKISSKSLRLSGIYQSIGSDSGNGSGDSVQTSASDSRK